MSSVKTFNLSIITGSGITALVTFAAILLMTHLASADGSLAIIMNKQEYGTGEPISFFVETRNQPEENAFPAAFIINGQNQTVWHDDDLPPNGSKEGMSEYYVSDNSENVPMINQTGEYSLFVTFQGQKAYEALTVTELASEDGMIHFYGPYQGLDNNNGTAQIANQTYYLMTIPGAPSDQTRPNDTTIGFHGVSFTFPGCGRCLTAPMPFNPLQPIMVRFQDNTTETLAVRDNIWSTIGMQVYTHEYFPNGTRGTAWQQIQHRDQIVTTLTQHTGPQAGITVTHDSVKLLVSDDQQDTELGAAVGPSNNWSAIGMPFQLSSPLKQFKSGIESRDVKCNSGFQLVIKAEDNSPACVKPETSQALMERGWTREISASNLDADPSCNGTAILSPNYHAMLFPVLLMQPNSTSCVKLTYAVIRPYGVDENGISWPRNETMPLRISDLNYKGNANQFAITQGKDYTDSFNIRAFPKTIDHENYPVGSNFTVTYLIKPLPNATGFYDQSIPMPLCFYYPLAVGYKADQVNSSDFSKGMSTMLNHSCFRGQDKLVGVEVKGMSYTEMKLP